MRTKANRQPPLYYPLVLVYCSEDEITSKAISYVGRFCEIRAMKVSFTQPEKQLSPYVAFIWVFESSFGVPIADSRIIVPDGRAKIIVPYRNSLCAAVNTRLLNAKEHQIFLVGIQSNPTTIGSTATDTGTIGVELTPKGLYHFFNLSMHEITNRMVSFEELFGPQGARLQNMVGDAEDPQEKIALLQTALTHLLQKNEKEYALLKEFKRFTGFTPQQYTAIVNEFGRAFHAKQ